MNRRLQHEYKILKQYEKELQQDGIYCSPEIRDGKINLMHWTCKFKFLDQDSPYYGQEYEVDIQLPSDYPQHPPKMRFITKIFHPNIRLEDGDICMNILKDEWTMTITIEQLVRGLQSIIYQPNNDSPYNCDASQLSRHGDELMYKSLVDYYYHTLNKK